VTELTPVEGGYRLSGRKTFGTLSPAADLLLVMVRLRRHGEDLVTFASVDRHAEGVDERDDWDALGMRASGSQSIVLSDCFVPEDLVFPGGTWGRVDANTIVNFYAASLALVGAFLGIAEEAHRFVVELVTTRRKAPSNRLLADRPVIQHQIAENEIDLAACRALLERASLVADEWFATQSPFEAEPDEVHRLMAHLQEAKLLVELRAIDVVDRTLTASGGAGYLASSPLARLYRDVRAGPFMQPYSPNEAYEYIGKVALGLDPTVG
jgi:alkylation response protein AidB-like acyl-CoA dehydrogenase